MSTESKDHRTGDLKLPWELVSDQATAKGLVREAKREVFWRHPLRGKRLSALARRIDCDDVLFEIDSGPKVAVVHLTWSGRWERKGFPWTEIFDSFDDFLATRMTEDCRDYGGRE